MGGMPDIVVVIPARYGSSRFPGKPLAPVLGVPILQRTVRIAQAASGVHAVYVATDDERIADAAQSFGAKVILTNGDYATGSDRVAAAALLLPERPRAVINLQGDALLTPPWVIEALATSLYETEGMVTPAVRLDGERYAQFVEAKLRTPASGTTVTVDRSHRALYFSKAIIPFVRDPAAALPPVYRHIGVYGYDVRTLSELARLQQSPLERAEGLEQLRALENGIPIRVVEVDYRGRTHWSVDHPDDIALAEDIIRREGELI